MIDALTGNFDNEAKQNALKSIVERIVYDKANSTVSVFFTSDYLRLRYGGPDGELGASLRYLSQRYSMPYRSVAGILTDVGTEEIGHLEMIATIVHQLTRNMTMEQIKEAGFETYFVDHTAGVYAQAAAGFRSMHSALHPKAMPSPT